MTKLLSLLLLFSFIFSSYCEQVKVTILQTTDIHCHLLDEKKSEISGWLALAPVIQKERLRAGGKAGSLLIDCGDTLQGSLIGSLTKGKIAVDLLNSLNYDIWVIGNHDFDYGPEILEKRILELKPITLAANLHCPFKKLVKPWVMLERKGAKIAVIGMTAPTLDRWLWGNNLNEIKVNDIGATLDDILPDVVDNNPDMIILAIHFGEFPFCTPEDSNIRRLARKYPQINLILGGHTHQSEPGKKIGSKTWYGEAGKHGEHLLKVEALIDTEKHQVIGIKSHLIPVDSARNIVISSKIKESLRKVNKYSAEIIGETETAITPTGEKQLFSPMSELICRSIAAKTGVKVVIHGSVSKYENFIGEITEKDLFNALPFEDTVGILNLTREEFRLVLEEQLQQLKKGRFQTPWGIYVNLNSDGKIGKMTFKNGKEWKHGRIKVAFNSYILAGAGGRFPVLKKLGMDRHQAKDTGISVRNTVKEYIHNHSPLEELVPFEWNRKN